ncbi:spore germination lipoprotein GerD [Cohnella sp. REN36]|uniref:spore germination lipoprotein GerD n=1 Tax=Cohnella sp. REN36 TaxID=2887347 RepID=UPI001D1467A6|nr:spore germination lipoprotein GerD [Cohnella sp. REN36]MCC3376613.1 spore gernimation protein [Cohnella sp. REN36]
MRLRMSLACALMAATAFLSSCGAESSGGGGEQLSYKDVKSMVVDILGSQEAQEALEKAQTQKYGTSSLHMQSLTPSDQEQVRTAVKDVLTSSNYAKVLEQIMTDTKFAGEFAKAVSKDNKQIHKDLLKDPTYQQELVSVFKSSEMKQVILESTKMPEYRKQMMSAVQEAVQSPLFKLELMKILQDVVKEELNPNKTKPSEQGKGGGGEGGGGGGGGQGGDSSQQEGGGNENAGGGGGNG